MNFILIILVSIAVLETEIIKSIGLKTDDNCIHDEDCLDTDFCQSNHCVNACSDGCFEPDWKCTAQHHQRECSCRPSEGYILTPTGQCQEICQKTLDCGPTKECRDSGIDDIKSCQCGRGYTSHLENSSRCILDLFCEVDNDCETWQYCHNNLCTHTCANKNCTDGEYQSCVSHMDHTSSCECWQNFARNSENICVNESLLGCQSDDDCNANEECQSASPRALCKCKAGFIRHKYDYECKKKCERHSDCDINSQRCSNNRCITFTKYNEEYKNSQSSYDS